MRTGITAAAAALAVVVAGCSTPSPSPSASPSAAPMAPSAPSQRVNQAGYSPAFRQGYAAGCDSVGASRPRRDEARYRADTDYMIGWNDGFAACGKGAPGGG